MTKRANRVAKLRGPFHEPIPFQLRLLWAASARFRLAFWLASVLTATLITLNVLPLIDAKLAESAQFLSQPGLSTLAGATLGASISLTVSYTLQRGLIKTKSLLEKRDAIYNPLLESVISFIHQLESRPYPWQIAHIGGEPNFSLQPQAGFLTWSDVVSTGRVIYVPVWLRKAFEALDRNLAEYNRHVRLCAHEV